MEESEGFLGHGAMMWITSRARLKKTNQTRFRSNRNSRFNVFLPINQDLTINRMESLIRV